MSASNGQLLCSASTGALLCRPTASILAGRGGTLLYHIAPVELRFGFHALYLFQCSYYSPTLCPWSVGPDGRYQPEYGTITIPPGPSGLLSDIGASGTWTQPTTANLSVEFLKSIIQNGRNLGYRFTHKCVCRDYYFTTRSSNNPPLVPGRLVSLTITPVGTAYLSGTPHLFVGYRFYTSPPPPPVGYPSDSDFDGVLPFQVNGGQQSPATIPAQNSSASYLRLATFISTSSIPSDFNHVTLDGFNWSAPACDLAYRFDSSSRFYLPDDIS